MEFNEETPPLAPDTKVISNNQEFPLSGKIVGIAQIRASLMGFLYIMELDENSVKYLTELGTYTYRCIAVPEYDLELQNEVETA